MVEDELASKYECELDMPIDSDSQCYSPLQIEKAYVDGYRKGQESEKKHSELQRKHYLEIIDKMKCCSNCKHCKEMCEDYDEEKYICDKWELAE